MRVIVVHEDGDRSSRVAGLAEELRAAVKLGTFSALGVYVEIQTEGELR